MKLNIRRTGTIVEDKNEHAGRKVAVPVRKVAVIAVIENPYASKAVEDLSPLIEASAELGEMMGKMALQALGSFEAQSYGKGGLVGLLFASISWAVMRTRLPAFRTLPSST
ncbi:MAG: amino acid synthesis family protein [Bradyrhizobium sp.]|jgi:hypothetical protein|nr:amino acid synthesis family protein [Bradyrhizobium sp.]